MQDNPNEPEFHDQLAKTYNNLGVALSELSNFQEARTEYLTGLQIRVSLAKNHPQEPRYQRDPGTFQTNVGMYFHQLNLRQQALEAYQDSRAIFTQLTQSHPTVTDYQSQLGSTHAHLGSLLTAMGQLEKAVQEYQSARGIFADLAQTHPDVPPYPYHLAVTCNNLGLALRPLNRNEEELKEYRLALHHFRRLTLAHPSTADFHHKLGGTLVNISNLQAAKGKPEEALRTLTGAPGPLLEAYQHEPRHPEYRTFLRNAYWSLAQVRGDLQRYSQALADWDRAVDLSPPRERQNLLAHRTHCLARSGDYRAAAATAEELDRGAKLSGTGWHFLARVCALNAASAQRDATRPLPERVKRAEEYASQAIRLLQRAAKENAFQLANTLASLDKDTDLTFLRDRADFQAFRLTLHLGR